VFGRAVYRGRCLDLTPEPPPRAKLAAGFNPFFYALHSMRGKVCGYVEGRSGNAFQVMIFRKPVASYNSFLLTDGPFPTDYNYYPLSSVPSIIAPYNLITSVGVAL